MMHVAAAGRIVARFDLNFVKAFAGDRWSISGWIASRGPLVVKQADVAVGQELGVVLESEGYPAPSVKVLLLPPSRQAMAPVWIGIE